MFPGIFRLLLADLRSSWFQAVAAVLLIGVGIIGVAYFTTQARQTQLQVQAAYQQEGAATFVVELSGISDEELDRMLAAVRQLQDVGSANAPYNGLELGAALQQCRSNKTRNGTVKLVASPPYGVMLFFLGYLRLIGIFDIAGPDRGRIDPFWRLSYLGDPLLTVRGTGGTEATTVPVVLNMAVVQDFLRSVELQRRSSSTPLPARSQLVVSATAMTNVPAAQKKVVSLLEAQGLKLADEANQPGAHSYRVLLPERNNFVSAQREQRKIGTGGTYFAALLLILLVFGTGGLQVLTTLTRWRDYGVLQAVGFSPGQILMVYGGQLLLVLANAILFAGLAVLLSSGLAYSREVFATAAVLAVVATVAGSVPALLWPMRIRPAAMLKELQ